MLPSVSFFVKTIHCCTRPLFCNTFSISPISTRFPLIFTWLSILPKYSILPSGSQRPKSPVLKIRDDGSLLKTFVINLCAVNSGRLRYPKATCTPAIQISPATLFATNLSCLFKIYTNMFEIGLPTGI